MAQQVQHTETSTMIKATKVADYIVGELPQRVSATALASLATTCFQYVTRSTAARR